MDRKFETLCAGGCPAADYYVKVQGCGRGRFELAMALAFNGREARYWTVTDSHGMIFFWYIPAEELHRNDNILLLKENYWDPTYMSPKREYLYVLKERSWQHEVRYHEMDEPQCVGQCLDIGWNWLKYDAKYPKKPQFDPNISYNNDGDEIGPTPGFEIGTHMDRFRSIHHCEGVLCYLKPSWLKEF